MADPVEPVVEQPVVAPVVEAAPVVVEQPVVETPAVEVEKPAKAAPVAERTPSLLEAAEAPGQKDAEKVVDGDKPAAEEKPAGDKPVEEKPAEPKPEEKPAEKKDGEPAAEEKPAEAAKPDPVEYEFTVPETITMDDARRGQFKEALDGFRADPKGGAQKLLDMHHDALVEYDRQKTQNQWDVFNETKSGWRKQVQEDELIGGAGHRTAMQAIATVRNAFVSDAPFGSKQYKADMSEFVKALDDTGAGDHPAILRVFYRFARRLNEPAAPHVLDSKPPVDAARRKGGAVLYDNDRSPTDRQ